MVFTLGGFDWEFRQNGVECREDEIPVVFKMENLTNFCSRLFLFLFFSTWKMFSSVFSIFLCLKCGAFFHRGAHIQLFLFRTHIILLFVVYSPTIGTRHYVESLEGLSDGR